MPEVSDEVYVDDHSVACDGGCGPLGHPRVYLAIDRAGRVECPYCSRRFIYRPAGQPRVEADPAPAEEPSPPAA
jgi:uncharacterized Zn-finger protein